ALKRWADFDADVVFSHGQVVKDLAVFVLVNRYLGGLAGFIDRSYLALSVVNAGDGAQQHLGRVLQGYTMRPVILKRAKLAHRAALIKTEVTVTPRSLDILKQVRLASSQLHVANHVL